MEHPDLVAIAEQHGRMVEIAIMLGCRDRAMAAVDRAFEALAEANRPDLSLPIGSIIGQRIASILTAGGIKTIGDLIGHTHDSLAEVHQIRYRSILIIESQLAKHGLALKRV